MSNDAQKADQIAFHFYTKLFHVVNDARATAEPRVQPKVDKWFNLETPDSDLFTKDARDKYRSISACTSPPPPLEIQVLLNIPDLSHNQVLVCVNPDNSRFQIKPTPASILLEKWVLTFTLSTGEVALPTIYKHGIPLFRSIYSLLRILPAWKLYKRLRRRMGANGNLSIELRVRAGDSDSQIDILDFESPPAPNIPPLPRQTHTFPSVPHPMGTLSLSATYLTSPSFRLDELESLLSSRFLSEGPEFVPTLVKNQQRDSMMGSSAPTTSRTTQLKSKSKSPPTSITIAERFILPTRTASTTTSGLSGTSPKNLSVPLPRPSTSSPMPAPQSTEPQSTGSGSTSTSPREGTAIMRLRRESLGMTRSSTSATSSSADLPGAPPVALPIPLRRPNINPVHPNPFKSSALASTSSLISGTGSPSVKQPPQQGSSASPLSSVGLPSLRGITASQHTPPQGSNSTRFPSVGPTPPSPVTGLPLNRPSPSSLGGPTAGGGGSSAESGSAGARKRYSSSFGHRYAASGGAASDGSAGSVTGERIPSASFLSGNTDDDDISEFVQDIDSRKPLSGTGRHKRITSLNLPPPQPSSGVYDLSSPPPSAQEHLRDRTLTPDEPQPTPLLFSPDRDSLSSASPGLGVGRFGSRLGTGRMSSLASLGLDQPGPSSGTILSAGILSTSPPAGTGPMLTSEEEVDEELRKMNERFFKSLEGLGGGSVRRRERTGEGEDSPDSLNAPSPISPVPPSPNSPGNPTRRRDYVLDRPVTTGEVAAMMLRDRQESMSRRSSPLVRARDLSTEDTGTGSNSGSGSGLGMLGQGSEEVIGRLEFDERPSSRGRR